MVGDQLMIKVALYAIQKGLRSNVLGSSPNQSASPILKMSATRPLGVVPTEKIVLLVITKIIKSKNCRLIDPNS